MLLLCRNVCIVMLVNVKQLRDVDVPRLESHLGDYPLYNNVHVIHGECMHYLDRIVLTLVIFVLGMLPRPSIIGTSYILLRPPAWSPLWPSFLVRILGDSQQNPLRIIHKKMCLLKGTDSS